VRTILRKEIEAHLELEADDLRAEGLSEELGAGDVRATGGVLWVMAVVLVATGLYGTLTYRVNLRSTEIGVRMAVGARRQQVVRMILKDALVLTAVDVVMGIPLALLVGRTLTTSLYGVKPVDLVAIGVAGIALLASAVPAG
jgi:ABC-type antimicrobial peptide transport system permease subunit